LVSDADLLATLSNHARALKENAGVSLELLVDRPNGAATAVVSGVECVLPLQGVVDFEEELRRLDKVLAKAEKDVKQLDKRLTNPKFVSKAPEHVVAEVQGKRDAAQLRLETLRASRTRIVEAMA
jgi:valyl-tRNA synthetase